MLGHLQKNYRLMFAHGIKPDGAYLDVFGYLPTLQILREGGYEGGDALLYTPFPGPFAESVEDRVLEGVKALLGRISR